MAGGLLTRNLGCAAPSTNDRVRMETPPHDTGVSRALAKGPDDYAALRATTTSARPASGCKTPPTSYAGRAQCARSPAFASPAFLRQDRRGADVSESLAQHIVRTRTTRAIEICVTANSIHLASWPGSAIRLTVVCALWAGFAGLAISSEAVYKCTAAGRVSYQGEPCDSAATSARTSSAELEASPGIARNAGFKSSVIADCPPSRPGSTRAVWRRDTLCLGITDDEVLNLPRWGRPTKIERKRLARGWEEAWLYESSARAPRRLHFSNGRLDAADDERLDIRRDAQVETGATNISSLSPISSADIPGGRISQ